MPTLETSTLPQLSELTVEALFMEYNIDDRASAIGKIIEYIRTHEPFFPTILAEHYEWIEVLMQSKNISRNNPHDKTGAELSFKTHTRDGYSSTVCIYGDPKNTKVTIVSSVRNFPITNFLLNIMPDKVEYNFE